jgi:hypothetical protein
LADYETKFGVTIQRKETITQRADRGTPYPASQADIEACAKHTFEEPIIIENWTMPSGAFSETCGPT